MSEERAGQEPTDDADELALDDLDELDTGEDADAGQEQLETPPAADGVEPGGQPPPRQNQFQRMRVRLREQAEDNRRLRASVEQLLASQRQQQQAPPPDPYRAAEAQRMEAERVAQMMPHEQAQYYARQSEDRMNAQFLRARLEVGDLIDRQSFAQLQREEPLARQWADQIEQMLTLARNQGQNPTREALYNQLLAQEVRNKTRREGERQRRNGRAAIERQTTAPGGGRSTASTPRRQTADDYDSVVNRLKNTRLGDIW